MAPYEDEEANWIEAVTATYFRVEEKMRHQHIGDFSTICVHAQQQPSLPVMYPKDTSEIWRPSLVAYADVSIMESVHTRMHA